MAKKKQKPPERAMPSTMMSVSDKKKIRQEDMMWKAQDMVRMKMLEAPVVKKEIKRVMKEMMALEKSIEVSKKPKK